MVEHKIAMAADASEQLHAFEALKDRASVIYSSLNSSKEVFVQRIYFPIITSKGLDRLQSGFPEGDPIIEYLKACNREIQKASQWAFTIEENVMHGVAIC